MIRMVRISGLQLTTQPTRTIGVFGSRSDRMSQPFVARLDALLTTQAAPLPWDAWARRLITALKRPWYLGWRNF